MRNDPDGRNDHARFAPPCRAACPADKDIPGFLRAIARDDVAAAWRIAFRENLFPGVLGWICPHPCETACRLAPQGESVPVCELKRWVTTSHAPPPDLHVPIETGGPDVAVVGAGPAGLAAAHDLTVAGAQVTLLDRADRPGGLLNGCIPEFRLPASVAAKDIERILSLGIEFRPGFELRGPDQLRELLAEGFAAVLLAVGAGDDRVPDFAGWRPGPGNRTAIEFLRSVHGRDLGLGGRRVAIVGGGNGAIDVARVARRLGAAEVCILYRRSHDELPAFPDEIARAASEGIRIEAHTVVDSIDWSGDDLRGVTCSRTRSPDPAAGRAVFPVRVPDTEHFVPCDLVVAAIGQASRLRPDDLARQDVYRCAAWETHDGTVVSAIASGRRAAERIVSDLGGSGRWHPSDRPRRRPTVVTPFADDDPTPDGSDLPFLPRHRAASEAGRCLGCDRLLVLDADQCILCGRCSERCVYDALSWCLTANGAAQLVIRDEECQRCGDCVAGCPAHALQWRPWRRPNRFFALKTIAPGSPDEASSSASAGED